MSGTMKHASFVVGLAVAILIAGCAQPEVPEDRFYRLNTPPAAEIPATPVLPGAVVVNRFMADGLLNERAIVHTTREAPGALRQYHYHRWTDPPTRMLQELTVSYLRSANAAPQVVTPELRAHADYEVTGKIKRLEHIRGKAPGAVVHLEIALHGGENAALLSVHDYQAEVPAPDESLQSAIAAFNDALASIYVRFLKNLAAARPSTAIRSIPPLPRRTLLSQRTPRISP